MNAAHQTAASTAPGAPTPDGLPAGQATPKIVQLRPPSRWHDPLRLIQIEQPSGVGRVVLWAVCVLVLVLIGWATVGRLDIIATADGKLAPQTLLKIVQPAEAGVVKELLVAEGDAVRAGQVLARLDSTLAGADKAGIASDLAAQRLQVRRLEAELANQPMVSRPGDEPYRYAQMQSQYAAHRKAYLDSVEQEKSLLSKAEHERASAREVLAKLEQTLPMYARSAQAYAKLENEGFVGALASADKQREAIEKARDLDAQRSSVAALEATIAAEHQKISQLQSSYHAELQRELADLRAKIDQLQPNMDKTVYREGLMELKAPQDGTIKDLATTSIGAVVQPGSVVLTLVPKGEQFFADVNIKNEDVGFVQVGQRAHIKLLAYPFQKYGMLTGKVIRVSADATEPNRSSAPGGGSGSGDSADGSTGTSNATYKARVQLDTQNLNAPQDTNLPLAAGMQVTAEINQGTRTALDYLLSPVLKTINEAGRER